MLGESSIGLQAVPEAVWVGRRASARHFLSWRSAWPLARVQGRGEAARARRRPQATWHLRAL